MCVWHVWPFDFRLSSGSHTTMTMMMMLSLSLSLSLWIASLTPSIEGTSYTFDVVAAGGGNVQGDLQ